MNIPKIEFELISLEENIDFVKWSFFEKDDNINIHKCTIELFNELSSLDINDKSEDSYKYIEEIVEKHYNKEKQKMLDGIKKYTNIWNKYNNKYFKMLSNYLSISFPKKVKVIKAKIGLLPVFPRYINDFSFALYHTLDDNKLIEVCAHETLHFLWFEKWKQLYPNTPINHFDSPYLEWKYSEMVTDPILNNKPFNELFSFEEKGYDSFYELYDNNELVMDKLRNIYSKDDTTDNKIKEGYKYIRSYFNESK